MKKTLSAPLCCALINIEIPIHSYGAQLENTPQEDCPTLIERVKQQGEKTTHLPPDGSTYDSYELIETYEFMNENSYSRNMSSEKTNIIHKVKTIVHAFCDKQEEKNVSPFGIDHGKTDYLSGVNYFTRLYFDEFDSGGVHYLDFVKVEGGYDTINMNTDVMQQDIKIGQSGWTAGGYQEIHQDIRYDTNSRWTQTIPSNWKPISKTSGNYHIGCTYEITYRSGGAPMKKLISNNI